MTKGEEYRIQQDAVKWFRLQYPQYVCFCVPNEATHHNQGYFGNLGLLKGVSDLIVVLPDKTLYVEFKSKTGRQSLEQKLFQQSIEKMNQKYYLVRSVDEFIKIIYQELRG